MKGMHEIIFVESGKEQMATRKTASRAETFKANILQAQEAYYSEKGTTDVDLDMPQRSRQSGEWVSAKMHSLYVEIVETAEKGREAETKKPEEHDKQRLEDEKALSNTDQKLFWKSSSTNALQLREAKWMGTLTPTRQS